MLRRVKSLALFALFPLAGLRAQSVQRDTGFVGACGFEIADEKWKLEHTTDKFDGVTRDVSRAAPWQRAGTGGFALVRTVAQRFVSAKHDTSYAVLLFFTGSDWMFISEGESLIFLADGKRIGLETPPRSIQRDAGRGSVTEAAAYPTTLATLELLASAKDLQAKLVGDKRDFQLTAKQPEVACSMGRIVRDVRSGQ